MNPNDFLSGDSEIYLENLYHDIPVTDQQIFSIQGWDYNTLFKYVSENDVKVENYKKTLAKTADVRRAILRYVYPFYRKKKFDRTFQILVKAKQQTGGFLDFDSNPYLIQLDYPTCNEHFLGFNEKNILTEGSLLYQKWSNLVFNGEQNKIQMMEYELAEEDKKRWALEYYLYCIYFHQGKTPPTISKWPMIRSKQQIEKEDKEWQSQYKKQQQIDELKRFNLPFDRPELYTDPYWVYKNWSYTAWLPRIQGFWFEQWTKKYPWYRDQKRMYNTLYQDTYLSHWYFINNYASNYYQGGIMPNPYDKLTVQNEKSKLDEFYFRIVPTFGTIVDWWKQTDKSKISFGDVVQFEANIDLRRPDVWVAWKGKKIEDTLDENKFNLMLAGSLLVLGIGASGYLISEIKK